MLLYLTTQMARHAFKYWKENYPEEYQDFKGNPIAYLKMCWFLDKYLPNLGTGVINDMREREPELVQQLEDLIKYLEFVCRRMAYEKLPDSEKRNMQLIAQDCGQAIQRIYGDLEKKWLTKSSYS